MTATFLKVMSGIEADNTWRKCSYNYVEKMAETLRHNCGLSFEMKPTGWICLHTRLFGIFKIESTSIGRPKQSIQFSYSKSNIIRGSSIYDGHKKLRCLPPLLPVHMRSTQPPLWTSTCPRLEIPLSWNSYVINGWPLINIRLLQNNVDADWLVN